jgi:hypothetical protein
VDEINFTLTVAEVDFLAKRLTDGVMTYQMALQVNALLHKMQMQANQKPQPTPSPPIKGAK